MYKEGYVVSVYGKSSLKNTIFSETEPTKEEVDFMVKDNGAIKAIVTEGKGYAVTDEYEDKYGNMVELD